MLKKYLSNKIYATFLVSISCVIIAGIVEFLVHTTLDQISDIQAHILNITLIGFVVASVTWMMFGKIERLEKVLKVGEHRKTVIRTQKIATIARTEAHQATMKATFHYINNTINQFTLLLTIIENDTSLDPELIKEIKYSLVKTAMELRDLGKLEDPTVETIEKFIRARL